MMAAGLFLTVSSTVFAQETAVKNEVKKEGGAMQQQAGAAKQNAEQGMEKRAQMESQQLSQKLGLDATQTQSVYNAALTRAKAERDNMKANQGNAEAMKAGNQKIKTDYDNAVNGVLTADQKAKYQQMATQKAQQMENRGKARAAAPAQQ